MELRGLALCDSGLQSEVRRGAGLVLRPLQSLQRLLCSCEMARR